MHKEMVDVEGLFTVLRFPDCDRCGDRCGDEELDFELVGFENPVTTACIAEKLGTNVGAVYFALIRLGYVYAINEMYLLTEAGKKRGFCVNEGDEFCWDSGVVAEIKRVAVCGP